MWVFVRSNITARTIVISRSATKCAEELVSIGKRALALGKSLILELNGVLHRTHAIDGPTERALLDGNSPAHDASWISYRAHNRQHCHNEHEWQPILYSVEYVTCVGCGRYRNHISQLTLGDTYCPTACRGAS